MPRIKITKSNIDALPKASRTSYTGTLVAPASA
jgi:hypothetical protein